MAVVAKLRCRHASCTSLTFLVFLKSVVAKVWRRM
jgi:hypothetical protein